jgi:hypothetical protein
VALWDQCVFLPMNEHDRALYRFHVEKVIELVCNDDLSEPSHHVVHHVLDRPEGRHEEKHGRLSLRGYVSCRSTTD